MFDFAAAFGQLYASCDCPLSYPQLVQRFQSRIAPPLIAATFVVRFLFDLSLNECSISTSTEPLAPADSNSPSARRQQHKSACEVGASGLRLSLQQLVHPGALVALLHLVLPPATACLRLTTSTSSSSSDDYELLSLASFVLELVATRCSTESNVHVLAARHAAFPSRNAARTILLTF